MRQPARAVLSATMRRERAGDRRPEDERVVASTNASAEREQHRSRVIGFHDRLDAHHDPSLSKFRSEHRRRASEPGSGGRRFGTSGRAQIDNHDVSGVCRRERARRRRNRSEALGRARSLDNRLPDRQRPTAGTAHVTKPRGRRPSERADHPWVRASDQCRRSHVSNWIHVGGG